MKKFTTIENREQRIAELKKEIKELETSQIYNYALVEVVPDCGAGIRDSETILVVCEERQPLIDYCIDELHEAPSENDRQTLGHKPCDTWYKIELTTIQYIPVSKGHGGQMTC